MPPSTEAPSSAVQVLPLTPFTPDLYERAWCSVPHPTLPLIATAYGKSVRIFSLSSLSSHSTLTGGHTRSIRSVAWKPNLPPHQLCLVTGSFDSTAGLWRWDGELPFAGNDETSAAEPLEIDLSGAAKRRSSDADSDGEKDWEFTLVLEGHDSEIKGVSFAPSGAYLATCSRDQTVWVWEDVGATEGDDEWETVAVLNEHNGDMKGIAWCPDVPGRNSRRRYSADVLASASYDNTVRIWREDGDGEWVCVAVLEGHDGTVWGVQWEQKPRDDGGFPRLLSYSADQTIRIWTLQVDDEDDDGPGATFRGGLGGIPNTMRRSLREEWVCTAVLPKAHTRDIYSVTWSATSGMVASTGSDSVVAVYREDKSAAAVDDQTNGAAAAAGNPAELPAGSSKWRVVAEVPNAHGPYEINHITWCKRYDAACEKKGVEEMLVTTGDEGLVKPWQVVVS
ncbi:putative D-/L-hydantoinase subunit A [Colletotrichum spaethianum]|uniref:Probable cytosolic iron-sulfur protein assembly protein 1 n=1 Tax=Colletotrichum spaethianum TaxID=700344 RepID=A0AA37UNX0_9PEZI|nr:putative D-/L-hydantoinase subunit A [Colletotrichum spaethianum]GKT49425.1 putative D-/L-hydantoinase subunit A [Colletotrichum spaethianum]